MTKTNAARILDAKGILYELVSYEVDETDLSAITVARKIGQDINLIYKTLVVSGDRTGIIVTVIPGGEVLDLKKAAVASGNKSVSMIAMKDILSHTGYIRGGCSPLGMKKKYSTYFHESCILYDYIFVSAGIRGLQIKINPQDLIDITGGKIFDLV